MPRSIRSGHYSASIAQTPRCLQSRLRNSTKRGWLIAALLLCASTQVAASGVASTTGSALTPQQSAYLSALDRLNRGERKAFARARADLADYILAPYLDYHALRKRLPSATAEEVHAFVDTHHELPVARVIRQAWLRHLGRNARWQLYRNAYVPQSSTQLKCYWLRARHAGGDASALADVPELWVTARSQPKECDPIFDAWLASSEFHTDLLWQRLALALEARQLRLARYLAKLSEGRDRTLATRFIDVHVRPSLLSTSHWFTSDDARNRAIILHGLTRLATRDPDAAEKTLAQYLTSHTFSYEEQHRVRDVILLQRAADGEWPDSFSDDLSPTALEPLLTHAVKQQHWSSVMLLSARLSETARAEPRWRYWRARAAAESGDPALVQQASSLLNALATERTYYGFLAAQRLGVPARLNPDPTTADPQVLARLASTPAIERSLELYAVGDLVNARREWNQVADTLDHEALANAAHLLAQHGWHYQAIRVANQAQLRDDLNLRFPVAHVDAFDRISHVTTVPVPFLMAIARQESAWDPHAKSSANARGLMQLLPSTARLVAKRANLPAPSLKDLYDPTTNIQLAGHHLARLLKRYNGSRPIAAAAYNAGERRADRWIAGNSSTPMDVWVENIPFRETRNYVKNTIAFRQVYSHKLGRDGPILEPQELVVP